MAQRQALDVGFVRMTLGGEEYRFVWGTLAIREMQEVLSTPDHLVSPDEIFREIKRNRLKYICALVWGGLLKHHPGITLKDVDDILDSATDAEMQALVKEFGLDLAPDPADAKELSKGVKKNPRTAQAKRGTGEHSTSKPAVLA